MERTHQQKKQAQLEKLIVQLPKNNEKRLMPIPGIFYGGGCSYMACRGLMMGPISDILLITHGPTGCGCFSGINSRRERGAKCETAFRGRCFSTNMRASDIIFGGEQKLLAAIGEAVELFHPKAIAVCATCPIGLIGDDIEQVAKTAGEKYGISVLPLSCEGFKTNAGWLHGGKMIVENWMGREEKPHGKYPLHYMSESYGGVNKEEIGGIFGRIGYDIVCSMMGSTTYDEIASGHRARLVVLDSNKEIDEVPKMMQAKFGSGFFRVEFTGISNIIASLRRIAAFFDEPELLKRTEDVIAEELERIRPQWLSYRERFTGHTAALFEDIFRSDSFSALLSDLGMEIVMISQDYKKLEFTDENFTVHLSQKCMERLALPGDTLFKPRSVCDNRVYLRMSRAQVSQFLRILRPDICFAGIEEQFGYSAAPIRSELFTSEERGVQYGGFNGFLRYARDLEMAMLMSHWVTQLPEWAESAMEELKDD